MGDIRRRLFALVAIIVLLASTLIYNRAFAAPEWLYECYWEGTTDVCWDELCYNWKSCDYQGWLAGNCISGAGHDDPWCIYRPGEEFCVDLEAWCPMLE